METFVAEWLGVSSLRQLVRVLYTLLVAMAAGALIGAQRELSGKPAGLRTHMLVALGTAMFVVAGTHSGMDNESLSRVIQGIAAGIGFLGAGTILKDPTHPRVSGLTTAASIWATAGIGVAIGLGEFLVGLVGAALTWLILSLFLRVENHEQDEPRARR